MTKSEFDKIYLNNEKIKDDSFKGIEYTIHSYDNYINGKPLHSHVFSLMLEGDIRAFAGSRGQIELRRFISNFIKGIES